jgi:hypothetical protein
LLKNSSIHPFFNEITQEIEDKVKDGYYQLIDLETLETINSNKNGLFRTTINEY